MEFAIANKNQIKAFMKSADKNEISALFYSQEKKELYIVLERIYNSKFFRVLYLINGPNKETYIADIDINGLEELVEKFKREDYDFHKGGDFYDWIMDDIRKNGK